MSVRSEFTLLVRPCFWSWVLFESPFVPSSHHHSPTFLLIFTLDYLLYQT